MGWFRQLWNGAKGGFRRHSLADFTVEAVDLSPEEFFVAATQGVERPARRGPPKAFYANIACDPAKLHSDLTLLFELVPKPPAQVGNAAPFLWPDENFQLEVKLYAPGFEALHPLGRTHKHILSFPVEVSALTPEPRVELHFRPQRSASYNKRLCEINAVLSYKGQQLGYVRRVFWLCRTAHILANLSPSELAEALQRSQSARLNVGSVQMEDVPDISILVQHTANVWSWRIDSPHPGVERSEESSALPTSELEKFARAMQERLDRDRRKDAYHVVRFFSKKLSKIVPQSVKDAICLAAQQKSKEEVSILFYGELTLIPWELIFVEEHWRLRPSPSPFLGAQAHVGRWLQRDEGPNYPPLTSKQVGQITVISGHYTGPQWRDLQYAREEAEELVDRFRQKARDVLATRAHDVFHAFGTASTCDAFHVALHGRMASDAGAKAGLVLPPGDDDYLQDHNVAAFAFNAQPFVFLNACEAASNYQLLECAEGLAVAFATSGASALVAPQWKVNDVLAKEVALAFYGDLQAGATVAEALRRQREKFSAAQPHPEYIAYQLFGHPDYSLWI